MNDGIGGLMDSADQASVSQLTHHHSMSVDPSKASRLACSRLSRQSPGSPSPGSRPRDKQMHAVYSAAVTATTAAVTTVMAETTAVAMAVMAIKRADTTTM